MKISPETVVANFVSTFVTDLIRGNVDGAAKPFLLEPQCSALVHVAANGEAIFTHTGQHIATALVAITELFANSSGAEVTHISATEIHSGVYGTVVLTVATPTAVHDVQLVLLLEQVLEESFFARAVTFTILRVQPVEQEVAVVEEPVVVEPVVEPTPEPTPEPEVPVAVEEEVVAVKPKKGKGKGKKAEEVQEAPAPAAPVEEEVVAAPEEVEAPAAPVVEERKPEAPAAPAGSKSWATLAASKPAAAPKPVVRVAPPTKEEPAAVEAPAPKKAATRPAAPRDATGDKIVFTTFAAVTDEQVHTALGKWAKHIVSLRNVSSSHQRVFADFSVEGVLEDLKDKVTIGGHKCPVFRQKPKE